MHARTWQIRKNQESKKNKARRIHRRHHGRKLRKSVIAAGERSDGNAHTSH
jgi:hypothetical protein